MSHVQMVPLCPSKVPIRRPSSDRHKLADKSFAQLMRRSPSRLNLHRRKVAASAAAIAILPQAYSGLTGLCSVEATTQRLVGGAKADAACACDACSRSVC